MSQVWQTFTTILDEDLCVVWIKECSRLFLCDSSMAMRVCMYEEELAFMLHELFLSKIYYMKFIITVHDVQTRHIKILVKYVLKSAWKLFMMIIITVMTEFFVVVVVVDEFYMLMRNWHSFMSPIWQTKFWKPFSHLHWITLQCQPKTSG